MTKKQIINIKRRQATVTNYNFSPVRAGDERKARAYLSLKILLEPDEIAQVVRTTDGDPVKLLWDKEGAFRLRDIEVLELRIELDGKAELGIVGERKMHRFDTATMSKLKARAHIDGRILLLGQLGLDPSGYSDDLETMTVREVCRFDFVGHVRQEQEPEPESDEGKQQRIGA